MILKKACNNVDSYIYYIKNNVVYTEGGMKFVSIEYQYVWGCKITKEE